MDNDLQEIWSFELLRSPAKNVGFERQFIKGMEEMGEVASAHLKNDPLEVKQELADSINVLLGLATITYEDYDEFYSYLDAALLKMSRKYHEGKLRKKHDIQMVDGSTAINR